MSAAETGLFTLTAIVTITAMAITLWMAFYLFARGFPSRITLKAVVVLFALSVFFFGAYTNIFHQRAGSAAWRAVLLVLATTFWYSVTYNLMSEYSRKRFWRLAYGIYVFALITVTLLLTPGAFINEEGNALYVAHMASGIPNTMYAIYQLIVAICILLNLLIDSRVGLTSEGKFFLTASIFPIGSILYGVVALTNPNPSPRLVQDLLIFCGVFLLGLSVARHQSLVERHTTLQDFPASALTALGLSAIYGFLALGWGVPLEDLGFVVGLAVLTHSIYDLVREFLERVRLRRASAFRKQLRQLENETTDKQWPERHLQAGLNLLCQTLNTSGGFIAIRQGEKFVVTATQKSVPAGSELSPDLVICEDVSRADEKIASIAWIAPAFDSKGQIAVLGTGFLKRRVEYSTSNLDLLAEVAEHIGRVISLSSLQPQTRAEIQRLVRETQGGVVQMNTVANEMLEAMAINPDPEFIKTLEDSLRHLSDYIELGKSPLADWAKLERTSQVERGKRLQQLITDSIESFRPAEKRPSEPLPRVWYNYVVLHDAYVEGVQNREIMARLYISEGTFNRTRRNALRGLARMLMEKVEPPSKAK